MNNIQTFSLGSDQYAKHRPQYPAELFAYLNDICVEHERAWDCATGNGQAAIACAQYFARVEAADISAEQIQHGINHPKVKYGVCPAEHTSFPDHSFDLITVALAVHWFDQANFFREVERVLKPGGVLALWGYGFLEIEPAVNALLAENLLKRIDRFWASGNRQIMNGYRDLTLPFDEVTDLPTLSIQIEWSLPQLLAYLRTWSAVRRYAAELGTDPVDGLEMKLKTIWPGADQRKSVKMPLFLRVSRKPG